MLKMANYVIESRRPFSFCSISLCSSESQHIILQWLHFIILNDKAKICEAKIFTVSYANYRAVSYILFIELLFHIHKVLGFYVVV